MTSKQTQKVAHYSSHVKKQTKIIIILNMQAVRYKNSYFKLGYKKIHTCVFFMNARKQFLHTSIF